MTATLSRSDLTPGDREPREGPPTPEELLILAANQRPASMTVASSLAEDTVFGQGIHIFGDPRTWALFASPFSGGMEELLFVLPDGELMHAWRPVGEYADADQGGRGWLLSMVSDQVKEVQTVVHPDGAVVYAFTIGVDGKPRVFALEASGQALPGWFEVTIPGLPDLVVSRFHVQYLDDAAKTPVVFARQPMAMGMAFMSVIVGAWDNKVRPWEARFQYALPQSLGGEPFAVGYDDPTLTLLRYYAVDGDGNMWRTSLDHAGGSAVKQFDNGWSAGIGGFVGQGGFGAVGVSADGRLRTFSPIADHTLFGAGSISRLDLGGAYDQLNLWQDSSGLCHLYGRDDDLTLHVLHQIGWQPYDPDLPTVPSFAPVWDTVQHNDKVKSTVACMRPLTANVFSYVVDAYPDQMPNQAVYLGRMDSEGLVITSQQLGTSYWEQETVRLTAPDSLLPQTQDRYQSKITVLNGYGAPVGGCKVTVTSDAPVDLDIAGRSYRVRPNLPATVTTDGTGAISVKVPAAGLVAPTLHFSVPGLANALTVQPAAGVHAFLAGAGTLPGHAAGLDAATIKAAKVPGGVDPLFPVLTPINEDATDSWPPDADEVIAWCQGAFAVSAGAPLPAALTKGLEDGEEVLAFSFQTHDRSRAATTVFSRREDLEDFRELNGISYDTEWFGDVVEGVRASVLSVSAVTVDIVNSGIAVLVEVAESLSVWLHARWDDVVSAAHAVEAIFSALGAKIKDVINWLSWAFGFEDVWATKQALKAEADNLAVNVKKATAWLRTAPSTWPNHASDAIDTALAAMAEVFGEQYMSRFESSGPQPGVELPLTSYPLHDFIRTPTFSWLTELMRQAGYDGNATFEDNPFENMLDKLFALPEWKAFGPDLNLVADAMFALFDWSNPNSAKNILVTAFLQVLEGTLKGGVQLAAAALPILLDFLDDLVDQLVSWGAQPVGSVLLQNAYDYIQQQAKVTEFETLTFADLGLLIGAYPATVLYKVAFGEAPFADGATGFDQLQIPGALPAGTELGDSEPPAKWKSLKLFQGYFVVMMVADGGFDVHVNNVAIAKTLKLDFWNPPKEYWVAWAYHHVLAYGIGDYPPFWGNEFPPEGWEITDWGPTVMWMMSAVANTADLGCACEWSTFIGLFDPPEDDAPGRVGPMIYFALGALRQVISGLRYMDGDDRDYPFAKWNLAINVTSFQSATTGWVRWGLMERKKRNKPDWPYWLGAVNAKSVQDFICDEFAGWASLVQIGYEDSNPPYIVTIDMPDATVGVPWAATMYGANGMTPYNWSMRPPKNPPEGSFPGFPGSLYHVAYSDDDPTIAQTSGTPEKSDVGTWSFYWVLEDDYGPGFKYVTELQQLVIKPAPEDT